MTIKTKPMNKQNGVVSLVNISTQKWPPGHRTHFGSLTIQSPQAGAVYAVTPVRAGVASTG